MINTPTSKVHRGRGMTLVELLMVLVILALLAGVALQSTTGVIEQSRYEATEAALENVESAVLGRRDQRDADGSPMLSGFVADIGRLPRQVAGDPKTHLQELWIKPAHLLPFALRQAPSDPDVTLGTGWRGYLSMGVTVGVESAVLVDGWGNPFDLLIADTSPASDNSDIYIIRSRGANNLVDTLPVNGYDADMRVAFGGTISTQGERWLANVSGIVNEYDAGNDSLAPPNPAHGDVIVRLFAPDPDTGGVLERTATALPPSFSYTFTDVPVGPRVIRAYQGTPISRKSSPVRLVLSTGGQVKDLTIRQ